MAKQEAETAENLSKVARDVDNDSSLLDQLLVEYLDLLDQYQTQRKALSDLLSSGHFSLAEANFKSSNRIRYGRDYYDERMQATRRIRIEESESSTGADWNSIRFLTVNQSGSRDKSASSERTKKDSVDDSPDGGSNERKDDSKDASKESLKQRNDETDAELPSLSCLSLQEQPDDLDSGKLIVDPIRWFGILVPSQLRRAQIDFSKAVEGPVPAILNIAAEMRQLEIKIGRARKRLKKGEAAGS